LPVATADMRFTKSPVREERCDERLLDHFAGCDFRFAFAPIVLADASPRLDQSDFRLSDSVRHFGVVSSQTCRRNRARDGVILPHGQRSWLRGRPPACRFRLAEFRRPTSTHRTASGMVAGSISSVQPRSVFSVRSFAILPLTIKLVVVSVNPIASGRVNLQRFNAVFVPGR
jgi:hypothetical protein